MRNSLLILTLLVPGLLFCASPTPDTPLKALGADTMSTLGSIEGEILIVNFWATWCPPCRVELPVLQRIAERYKDKSVSLVTISVDKKPSKVEKFIKKKKLQDLPVYFLEESNYKILGVDGLPMTFVMKKNGDVLMIFSGYTTEMEDQLKEFLDSYLKEKKAA